MSLLKNLKSDDSIKQETDSVGTSFGAVESGVYPATISLAYLEVAKSEAIALVVHAKTDDGREIQQKLWVQSGKDKGSKNYYVDKDGAKNYLPGYLVANSLALLGAGKPLNEFDTEEKVVKLYSYDAKADVPTKVDMVTELLGKRVLLGVVKQKVDKTVKGADGQYQPTGEFRYENEIDKVFRERDGMTTSEIIAKNEKAEFIDTWKERWVGKERNKAKGAAAGQGVAGAPAAAAAGAVKKATTSLFA